jgi:hypothetical protein
MLAVNADQYLYPHIMIASDIDFKLQFRMTQNPIDDELPVAAIDRSRSSVEEQTNADKLLLAFVVAIALAIAMLLLAAYYTTPDALWRGIGSDRSLHFMMGVNFALALQTGGPGLLKSALEIALAGIYPPLQDLLLAAILLIGGLDPRLGTIPGLLGWVGTVALTWSIARRMYHDRMLGRVCAAVAAIFALASPTFRLISNDVMLEGLGAALSALAMLLFMRACAEPEDAGRWRWFALSLTALFYQKSNYWGLTAFSLAVAYVAQNPRAWRQWIPPATAIARLGQTGRWMLHLPFLIILLAMTGLIIFSLVSEPKPIELLGVSEPKPIELLGLRIKYEPLHVMQQTFAVLCVWLGLLGYQNRELLHNRLGVAGRAVLYWHLVPAMASFLVKGRLYNFFWYVGPADSFGGHFDPLQAASFYWAALSEGFTVAPWAAWLALGLAAIAFLNIRRFDAIRRTPFIFVVVCATALLLHPNHQGRFLSSWIFALWICAGVGAAAILEPWIARSRRAVAAIAVAAVAVFAAANAAQKPSPEAANIAIQTPGFSELELSRIYAPYLVDSDRVGVLYAHPFRIRILFWVAPIQCRCRVTFETPYSDIQQSTREEFLRRSHIWLASTEVERVIAMTSPDGYASPDWIKDAMAGSDRFELVDERAAWSDQASVMVWRRK